MSNTEITIKNGKMIKLNSRYVLSNRLPIIQHIEANGWKGNRREDKSLIFEASREYTTGESNIRCIIFPDGDMRVTIKEGNSPAKKLYKTKLADSIDDINGKLILSGGHISERYCRFRHENLCSFLDKYELTRIINKNPNGEYDHEYFKNSENFRSITTDGLMLFEGDKIDISDASWVIVKERKIDGVSYDDSAILYTKLSMEEFDKLF